MVVGHPHEQDGRRYNAASLLQNGKVITTYHKHELPNHSVFDEERYFDRGDKPCVFELDGIKFGLNICADIWEEPAALTAHIAGAQILLVINASPYHIDKQHTRYEAIHDRICEIGIPVIYANLVGGQDELVFDGSSFAMSDEGHLTHQFAAFKEDLGMLEIQHGNLLRGEKLPALTEEESIYSALCLGVKDYIGKNGFPGVILGLSGGIDSALTLAVAVDALGADKVRAVMMPSPYTAEISWVDSRDMAKRVGVRYD